MLAVNESIGDAQKPFDFVIKGDWLIVQGIFSPLLFAGFYDLFFMEAEIDKDIQKTLIDHHCISQDGKKVRLYIKMLGETCQILRKITGANWMMREVLGHSMLYMFAKVLDHWLRDVPECKWFQEGGSERFFSDFLPRYLERGDGVDTGIHGFEGAGASSEEVNLLANRDSPLYLQGADCICGHFHEASHCSSEGEV